MSVYDDLKRDLQRIKTTGEGFIPDRAKLGWVVDGVYTIIDPQNPRRFWVRFTDQGGGISGASIEHRGNVTAIPDLDVLIAKDRFSKQLYIWGVSNEARNIASSSGDDPSIGLHFHDRYSGRAFLIDDRLNFKFRADPISGLLMGIKAGVYFHNNTYHWMNDKTIDLTANRPSTTGHHAWVVVGIDTAAKELVAVTGTSQPTAQTLLKTQIFDVAFDWVEHIPLFAVRLVHGQTASPVEQDYEALLDVSRAASGGYYQTITDDGTPMAQRPILDVYGTGVIVTDDAGNNRTRIQITGGGGGGALTGDVLPATFQARLTLTSGVPVTTSDVTAATTVYLTPYRGNVIALYDGTNWTGFTLAEISLSLSGFTANTNYDIFVYDSSGLTLEGVAWTNNTTRATSIVLQNGVYVKSGDTTKRYAGTIRITSAAGQTEDSIARRYVYNYYNRVYRELRVIETANSWTTNFGSWRSFNNSTANRFEVVVGVQETRTRAQASCFATPATAGNYSAVGVGIDSTSTNSAGIVIGGAVQHSQRFAIYDGYLSIGYHYIQMLEITNGNNTTFYGDNGTNWLQSGMVGETWA